jgi:putative tryptophan/tyrosine transport system substrate-binding protein
MRAMRRREVIGLLGGVAAGWPLSVSAQPAGVPAVGLLTGAPVSDRARAALHQGLAEGGFVEGRNISIEHRWASDGEYGRLPALAAELVGRNVAVIIALAATSASLAAKNATTTIPVVFATGSDPVRIGLVASLNRPGGNVTGVTLLFNTLGAKRFELLRELVPRLSVMGFLANPKNPNFQTDIAAAQAAAASLGHQIKVVNAGNEQEIDAAFAAFAQHGVQAVVVNADAFYVNRATQLVELAARHALPASYHVSDFSEAGGLMSYGGSRQDAYRLVGLYAARILKGEKPADLPVQQITKLEFIINLKTARALGLNVPLTLQAAADEVIE